MKWYTQAYRNYYIKGTLFGICTDLSAQQQSNFDLREQWQYTAQIRARSQNSSLLDSRFDVYTSQSVALLCSSLSFNSHLAVECAAQCTQTHTQNLRVRIGDVKMENISDAPAAAAAAGCSTTTSSRIRQQSGQHHFRKWCCHTRRSKLIVIVSHKRAPVFIKPMFW